jgi:hypothetical protein
MSGEPQEIDEVVGELVEASELAPMSSLSVMCDFNDLYVRQGERAWEILARLKDLLA